jgi:hypothetical protein
MGTINNLFSGIETAVIQAALPTLTNIQTALQAIEQNPGNPVILAQQEAVIIGSVNTLMLEAPALIPALQSQAIAAGAGEGVTILGEIIAALQAQITPPASSKK